MRGTLRNSFGPDRTTRGTGGRALLLIAAALGVGLPGLASDARADTVPVYVFDFDFSSSLPGDPITDPTINLGDTVRWIWLDDHHTTTACLHQAEFWRSDMFDTGDTFEHTFTTPGVYWYYCEPHGFDKGDGTAAGMAGTITVVPAPGALLLGATALVPCVARRRRL